MQADDNWRRLHHRNGENRCLANRSN
jgi:hypothetical protein